MVSKEKRAIPKSWGEVYFYREAPINRIVSIVSVLLAVGLLFGAICCLAFISPATLGRSVGMIGAFTAVFAIIVGIFTNSTRSELFTAVAG